MPDFGRPVDRSPPRRFRDVPWWVPVLVFLVAAPLAGAGTLSLVGYVVDHTTVTVNSVTWAVSVGGATEYWISCGGGEGNCPTHAKLGSEYATTFVASGYFAGKNLTLSVPGPFRIVSTDPALPVMVPPNGITVSVDLGLPSTAGEYSCLGTATFQ